jgi:4-amino-4-deoxy-L-arabinose transferase-like glycosyltransferase
VDPVLAPVPRKRRLLALLLVLASAALILLPRLGSEGLTDPDESAYAESVREMSQRGDWLVPHLYGEPLLDKPILIYWLIGGSFRLFGRSELAARIPSVLAAFIMLLATWRLGALVHQSETAGALSAAVLASALEFAMMGRAAVTDMLLTLFCTLAILCVVELLEGRRSRWLGPAAAACMGLAVLTKGPVGLALPLLVLGSYIAAARAWSRLRELRPFTSVLVFLAVTVPWYAAIALRRPDLVEQFFVTGNLGRFMKAEHRSQPALYYLVVLIVGFLPWSAFLPGTLARAAAAWRKRAPEFPRILLPALWLVSLVLFFTLAASKLPSYILPALPAAAVLVAGPLTQWWDPPRENRRLPGTGAAVLLVILAGGMLYFAMSRQSFGSVPSEFKVALLPVCFAGFLGSLFVLTALILQRPKIGYLILQVGSLSMILALLFFGFPLLEPWKSSRDAATAIRPMIRPEDRLVLYRVHHPGFGYYMDRIPELVRSESALELLVGQPGRTFCLMGRDNYEKLRTRTDRLPLYLLKSTGHVVVLTNRPPGESP